MCANCNNSPIPQMTEQERLKWEDDYLNGRLVYPRLNGKSNVVSRSVEPEKTEQPSERDLIIEMLKQKGIKFKLTQSTATLRQLLEKSNEK